jgi:hypothetical protein
MDGSRIWYGIGNVTKYTDRLVLRLRNTNAKPLDGPSTSQAGVVGDTHMSGTMATPMAKTLEGSTGQRITRDNGSLIR